MNSAQRIIELFGGTRKLAGALNFPPSTVQSWKEAGLIPAKHQQTVLDKARELGVDIGPADFFPSNSELPATSQAGATA